MSDVEQRTLTISGVKVKFPCKPYPSQFGMMDRVIKGLERRQNGLLESPTGSGKSLALLCSALAWQQAQHEKIIREQLNTGNGTDCYGNCTCGQKEYSPDSKPGNGSRQTSLHELSDDDSDEDFKSASKGKRRKHVKIGYEDESADGDSGEKCKCACSDGQTSSNKKQKVPKIFYGTRTHKQIGQIARELKKTAYKNVRMAILASREYTCIHPQVVKLKNKSDGCRERLDVKGPGCKFNDKSKRVFLNQNQLQECDTLKDAWDLEDFVAACQVQKACPYFVTRNIISGADIIFCPYNYLIDPLVRKSMEIDLKEQIVILDEAHNMEDSSRDAASGSLTTEQINQAIYNLQELLDHNLKFMEHLKLKKMLENVLQFIEDNSSNLEQKDYDQAYKVWSGFDIVVRLKSIDLGPENFESYKACLEKALESDENEVEMRNRQNQELKLKSPTIKTLELLLQVLDYMYRHDLKFVEDYRVAILKSRTYMNDPDTNNMWINSRNRNRASRMMETYTLNFWCMNPAVAFSDFTPARNVILSSGTLSPMSSFASELGVPFPIQLEANHVIQDKQVWVGAIGRGPSGATLQAVYKNMETWDFQDELGKLIHKICMTVPHGVLCFLPSYRALEKFTARWKQTKLWYKIAERKRIMMEPRASDKESFDGMMKAFYQVVKGETCYMSDDEDGCYDDSGIDGALFFAVCRGKVSEGMDFADNNARAVITVGIPYPSIKDLQVKLKREYNDRYRNERGLLSGNEWYEIQAFRALNQALGRCLRHRKDWGALIIVDDRFVRRKEQYCKGLSKWVRSKVQTFENFTHTLDSLGLFTEEMIKEMPVIDVDTSFIPCTPGTAKKESLYKDLDSTYLSNSPMVGSQETSSSYFSPPEKLSKPIFQTPYSSTKIANATPAKAHKSDVTAKGANPSAVQSPVTPGNQQFQQLMSIINSAGVPNDRPYYVILNQGLPNEQTFLIEPPKGADNKGTEHKKKAEAPGEIPVVAIPSTQKLLAPTAPKSANIMASSSILTTPAEKPEAMPTLTAPISQTVKQNKTFVAGQVNNTVNPVTPAVGQMNVVSPDSSQTQKNLTPLVHSPAPTTHFVLQNQKLVPLMASQMLVNQSQGLLLLGNNTVPGSSQILLSPPSGLVPASTVAGKGLPGQKMTSLLGNVAAPVKQETTQSAVFDPQNTTQQSNNPNKLLKFVNLPATASSKVATVAPMRPENTIPVKSTQDANQTGFESVGKDKMEGSLKKDETMDTIVSSFIKPPSSVKMEKEAIKPQSTVVALAQLETIDSKSSVKVNNQEKEINVKTTLESIDVSNVKKRPLFKARKSLSAAHGSDMDTYEKKSCKEGLQDSEEDFRTDKPISRTDKPIRKEVKVDKSDVDLGKTEVKNTRHSKSQTESKTGKAFNAAGMTTRRNKSDKSFDVYTCSTDIVKTEAIVKKTTDCSVIGKADVLDTESKSISTRGETKKSVADKLKQYRRETLDGTLQEIKVEEDNDFVEKIRSPMASPEEALNTRRRRSGRKRKSSPSKMSMKRSKGVDFVDEVEDEKENKEDAKQVRCAKCGGVFTQNTDYERRRRNPSFLKKLWPQNAEVLFFPSLDKLDGLQIISASIQGGIDLNCYYDSTSRCAVEYLECKVCRGNTIIGARIVQCHSNSEFQQNQMWLLYSTVKH